MKCTTTEIADAVAVVVAKGNRICILERNGCGFAARFMRHFSVSPSENLVL